MSLKVDVLLAPSVVDAARRARELEDDGVDGIFSFENDHDIFFPLVAAAPVCSLDLLTNVAMAFPRSPLHLAHAAYDLQLLSEGRFRLGLGSQVRAHVERRYGASWGKPVAQMREWVTAIKTILHSWQTGEALDFRGQYTTHTLMTPVFNPGPNPFGLPKVVVGALGPRMNQMAAEVADGILVMPFNTVRHMRERTIPAIAAGLERAGRGRQDLELTAEVVVALGGDDAAVEAARRVARFTVAFYGSTPAYRPVLDVEGWGDLQPELNALSKRGEWTTMAGLIDDTVLDTIAVSGTPRQCASEIIRRFGDCDRVCTNFSGPVPADHVLAEFTEAMRSSGP